MHWRRFDLGVDSHNPLGDQMMTRHSPWKQMTWGLLLALWVARAWGDPPALAADPPVADEAISPAAKFLRIARDDDDEPVTLDTAIVRYVSTDPENKDLVVDLVGVIHIGEKSYYEALNKELDGYDAVLYELVAPEGTRIEKGEPRSAHPISALQGGMKSMLGLEMQVDHIDYQKEHFHHADMSPEAFAKSMEDRGENMFTMFFRMLGQSIAQQAKMQARQQAQGAARRRSNDADMLLAMFDRRRSHKLKQLMAEQFEDLEAAMSVFDGPDGSTIITERNKVALEGLKKQIDGGKRKLAVFYGAGHMPDMEKRLLADFQLQRQDQRWLPAWELQPKANKARPAGEAERE